MQTILPAAHHYVSAPPVTEKTFTNFTPSQGANYAQNRGGYHPTLYETILSHHTATGGQLNSLLDIGCGPGTVARALAPHFQHVVGLDPSDGMIQNARLLGGTSGSGDKIRYDISSAEQLGSNLEPRIEGGSVDLITAATAAHWFNMPHFWQRAACVLKPGGTVALWTVGSAKTHPSTPNAASIEAASKALDDSELQPYYKPGNRLAQNLYVDLPLPWTVAPPIAEFDKESYFRKEWGPEDGTGEILESSGAEMNLEAIEKIWGTMSQVQRWRDAHPEEAGTEKDIVKRLVRVIANLLHEAGVEEGKEMVKVVLRGVLMMVKKRA